MTSVLSEYNSERMIALVKAALHGTTPDNNLFVNITEADWNEIFENSVKQGVRVLSLEGLVRLPKELQPPLALKLRWIAGAEAIDKRYRHCLETAKKLSAYFKENNIKMLIFKGLALSRLYPVANGREFGDMDVFFCGKTKEGDELLSKISNGKSRFSKKDTKHSYRGITIENHHTFLYHSGYKNFLHSRDLEKQLMNLLKEAGMLDDTPLAASETVNETLLFPPPDFDAIFVMLHMLSHFPKGIALRHLCDLTVLFAAHKGKIDFLLYQEALSKAGLLKLGDSFISLLVKYLGLSPEDAPPYKPDEDLENRLWNDLLYPAVAPLPKEKRTFLTVFIHKIRLLQSIYWRFKLVPPGRYWTYIFRSIYFHISHPQTIGKLKK